MEYDKDKVDEITLALLYLTTSRGEFGAKAWKGIDKFTLDRLLAKGHIAELDRNKPTLLLSEEGEKQSRELFEKHFGTKT